MKIELRSTPDIKEIKTNYYLYIDDVCETYLGQEQKEAEETYEKIVAATKEGYVLTKQVIKTTEI